MSLGFAWAEVVPHWCGVGMIVARPPYRHIGGVLTPNGNATGTFIAHVIDGNVTRNFVLTAGHAVAL